jgi:ornithine decarboxylase
VKNLGSSGRKPHKQKGFRFMTYDTAACGLGSAQRAPHDLSSHQPASVRPKSSATLTSLYGVRAFYGTADEAILATRPQLPLYLTRPNILAQMAREFVADFPGDVVYAVKCNPEKSVLQILSRNGVKAFDVASLEEVRSLRKVAPRAKLFFMHPIKSPEAIAESYFTHNVRAFVLDSVEELEKILTHTNHADDLELFVRLTLPKNDSALIDFSCKFGAEPALAAELLRRARAVSPRIGLCLHVGTQTLDPTIYTKAIMIAGDVIRASRVTVDVLDVGGGFPVDYGDGSYVPPRSDFIAAIKSGIAKAGLEDLHLMCEPGRALVAPSASLVVRVEGRKGDCLYINDGTYGGLFDAGKQVNGRFTVRRVSDDADTKADLVPFRFAGPTCDSIDMMNGPFYLPNDIKAGEWIEIKGLGGYSVAMRTNFNGFGASERLFLLP